MIKYTTLCLTFTLVSISMGCATVNTPGPTMPDPYAPELIIGELGKFAFDTYLKLSTLSSDKAMASLSSAAVTQIVKKAKLGTTDWNVQVVDTPSSFALAFPGGGIIVSSGLIDLSAGDPALLSVAIAHEMAHVEREHFLKRLKEAGSLLRDAVETMKKPGWTLDKGFDPKVTTGILAVMAVGKVLPFDKDQEYEADVVGVELLKKVGIQPARTVEFWSKVAQHRDPDGFSLTHPSVNERIALLKSKFPELSALKTDNGKQAKR